MMMIIPWIWSSAVFLKSNDFFFVPDFGNFRKVINATTSHFTTRCRLATSSRGRLSHQAAKGLWWNAKCTAGIVINQRNKARIIAPSACWFTRTTLNQRLSIRLNKTIYPLKSMQQAATVVSILESELALTYSDWRASIRHFKTLCNWHLSADCLWICSAQINTSQLYVCIAVIVMQGGNGEVEDVILFISLILVRLLWQAPLLWDPTWTVLMLWHYVCCMFRKYFIQHMQ